MQGKLKGANGSRARVVVYIILEGCMTSAYVECLSMKGYIIYYVPKYIGNIGELFIEVTGYVGKVAEVDVYNIKL